MTWPNTPGGSAAYDAAGENVLARAEKPQKTLQPSMATGKRVTADGHTASNTPDLFRTPQLTDAGPGQY